MMRIQGRAASSERRPFFQELFDFPVNKVHDDES
jgi:hypothetical protein